MSEGRFLLMRVAVAAVKMPLGDALEQVSIGLPHLDPFA